MFRLGAVILLSLNLGVFGAYLRQVDSADSWEAPWYCHTLDCPSFVNSTTTDGLQIRSYDSLLWASTDVEGTDITAANNIGFQRLFDYISGANDESIAIDMTTPVLDHVQPGLGPNCNSTFTVSFFVPYKYQNDQGPPKPTDDKVYIQAIEVTLTLTLTLTLTPTLTNPNLNSNDRTCTWL